ncbi:NAD(P)-dependent dehydrogenase [Pseudomonas syringae pv. actinidiae]|uniref:NAD(P)-dependent dehydrogenase n=1 Tax=Pseudomonas syringae pv. actinidiae TaxID=103796 RepID=A0AAN4Q211_PSESF|nr:NAD(P)-dependent dehydrogenase [Pseudomonas syringae pv. actinidiae]
MNAHRYALGQADPVEGRVHVGDQLAALRVVAVVDAPRDAFDTPREDFAAHQLQVCRVTHLEVRQLGFLEKAIDPERVHIDHRHLRFANARVVAAMHVQVGDVTVDRRQHACAGQVQFGRFQLRLSQLVIGECRSGDIARVVTVFCRDNQFIHVGTALCVELAHLPRRLA